MSPGKVRQSVVAAKSEAVRRMVEEIGTLPLATVSDFTADRRMVAAGESYLRRCLEALLDLGRHILAKGLGRPVAEYKEIARELERAGILAGEQAKVLTRMAGYRNRLVHFYDEVTAEELHAILTGRLDDVEAVLAALTGWLRDQPEKVDRSL